MDKHELKRLQADLGWSNSELARRMGVTVKAVEYWRSGRREMSGPAVVALRLYCRQASRKGALLHLKEPAAGQ